jgi:uncharacterized protein
MPYSVAIKAIDLFLNSPGYQKILIIYGGEPLLYFDLLKKIIIYAQKETSRLKKHLIISLGTNGILLEQDQLDFFRFTNTKLSLSLDGKESFHNKMRVFRDKGGSFLRIYRKIPIILKKIKRENICILFGILPSSVRSIYENFVYLTSLGFDSINIEPIHSDELKWHWRQNEIFLINMINIIQYIYKNISKNNFIFLNTVNRELKNKRLTSRRNMCLFFENLEVYPEGEMAFSPFLINSKNRNRYIIGNITEGLPKKYKFCKFNLNDEICKNCWNNYRGKEKYDFGKSKDVYKIRNMYSIHLAKKVIDNSRKEPLFKRYIQEAKKRIFE